MRNSRPTLSPLKQEKHPYKLSAIKYNSIDTGPSQNIL